MSKIDCHVVSSDAFVRKILVLQWKLCRPTPHVPDKGTAQYAAHSSIVHKLFNLGDVKGFPALKAYHRSYSFLPGSLGQFLCVFQVAPKWPLYKGHLSVFQSGFNERVMLSDIDAAYHKIDIRIRCEIGGGAISFGRCRQRVLFNCFLRGFTLELARATTLYSGVQRR